jgi:hypothetical protein
MLVDRLTERSALDSLLASARAGMGSALVLRGDPGIGKTALLEYAIESASGFRIARAVGVESEMELAFAALHQLCAPALDRLDRLPDPQRDALGVAFGLRAGEAPDRFLVGLAVLNLLSEVTGEQPLLCVCGLRVTLRAGASRPWKSPAGGSVGQTVPMTRLA